MACGTAVEKIDRMYEKKKIKVKEEPACATGQTGKSAMIVKNALLHLGKDQVMLGDLKIENGKIAALGNGLSGGEEKDYSGRHIYAGAMAFWTPARQETAFPVLTSMDACYSVEPAELKTQAFAERGITDAVVVPGNKNVLSGYCAVIKTVGDSLSDLAVKQRVAMKGALTDEVVETYRPASASKASIGPMGMIRLLQYALAGDDELTDVREGKLPLLMTCYHDYEIRRVLEATRQWPKMKLLFQGCAADEKLEKELTDRGAELLGSCPRRMAEAFGVADRIGALKEGLDADLTVYAADGRLGLLETLINGKTVYRA